MKKFTILLLLLLIPVLVSAQHAKKSVVQKMRVAVNDPVNVVKTKINPFKTMADGNYVVVDTMSNGYGPASGNLNPLAFDPYSGVLCFVHRGYAGYAAGSGQLWYNISTDYGVTWSRVAGGVNTSNPQITGRYPSMAISNAAKGPIDQTIAFFSWPELIGGAFGGIGYGADQPAGAGTEAAFLDQGTPNLYSSASPSWASDKSADMFWVGSYGQSPYGIDVWTTPDFGTINKYSPPQWSDSALGSSGDVELGGESWQGVQYFGVMSGFSSFTNPNPITLPGYSKSTDNGATWSNFKVCDWRQIPKLANYDVLLLSGAGYLQGDMHVDKNSHPHLVVTICDTTVNSTTYSKVAIVDLFETATGWDATVIADDIDTSSTAAWQNGSGMGLGQMGTCDYLAFDTTRNIMAAQYINTGKSGYADVYLKYKKLGDTAWSAAMNLTNSDSTDNSQTQFAPFLRTVVNGNSVQCTAFSMYGYQAGVESPTVNPAAAAIAYVGAETFTVSLTGVNDKIDVNSFALSQNYPNPFNPSTMVNYSLPQKSNVSLKVYDILGREVASLVNATQEAGNHSVSFNASKLASGLYIYTLKAGNNVSSKKMMLLK